MKKPRIILFAIILIVLVLFSLIYIGLSGALSKRKHYNSLPELSYYHGVIIDENKAVIKTAKVSSVNYPKIISTTDDSGNFILEDKSIDVKIPNRIIVKKNKKWGMINFKTKPIIHFKYDKLRYDELNNCLIAEKKNKLYY